MAGKYKPEDCKKLAELIIEEAKKHPPEEGEGLQCTAHTQELANSIKVVLKKEKIDAVKAFEMLTQYLDQGEGNDSTLRINRNLGLRASFAMGLISSSKD